MSHLFSDPDHAVYSLQTMLRTISYQHPDIPRLTPDGYFGERTLEAVMLFQRSFHPPVTGTVDHATWNAVSSCYRQALWSLLPPSPCDIFPNREFSLEPGQKSIHLYPVQAMFLALSTVISGVQPGQVNGNMDEITVSNIRWLQRQNRQAESGIFDLNTWETLTELYSILITSSADRT